MSIPESVRLLPPAAVLFLATSSALHAQEWSPAEREVWQFIEQCNQRYFEEDRNGVLACYHDDFVGWAYGDPAPRTKDSVRKFLPSELESAEPVAYDVRPIAISVFGDTAVAHYALKWVEEDDTGARQTIDMIWTDVLLRQDGRWSWIGDHGGRIGED